jgi:hypothetical protein
VAKVVKVDKVDKVDKVECHNAPTQLALVLIPQMLLLNPGTGTAAALIRTLPSRISI